MISDRLCLMDCDVDVDGSIAAVGVGTSQERWSAGAHPRVGLHRTSGLDG
jgi:hypothetical protein